MPKDDSKLIPLEKLTSESVLYWRCLVEFLKNENLTEEMDLILPELSFFCTYINDFNKTINNEENQHEFSTKRFIFRQLFEIAKLCDLADELGRTNLKELILQTLQKHRCTEKMCKCLVSLLDDVVPDVDSRISLLVEVINEIRVPTNIKDVEIMSDNEIHKIKMEISLKV